MFLIKKLQTKYTHEKQYSQPATKLKKLFSTNGKNPHTREGERGKKPSTNSSLVETHALAASDNRQSPKPKLKTL